MLLLFDIDGTLLSTSGAGMRAMDAAGRDWFGPDFHTRNVPYAGRLDPLIIADILRLGGAEVTIENLARFRRDYAHRLPDELERSRATARALPGVPALLEALARRATPKLGIGLLTGNFAETGTLKLTACGLAVERFAVRVWGDESPSSPPTRDDLPRVGMIKYARQFGHDLRGDRVVVIGDTPFDVRCAQAHGCRSLAVATGSHDQAALQQSGATRVVADLSATDDLVDWLLKS